MKFCPTCKATYADDANFCPQETCATASGPQRLLPVAGEVKARFQLGPRIGGGSTGEVFRATDTVTGAQVAYKIVASDVLPNAAALARAEREFKQLMRVQTPRIATIIDCGRTPDERLYVAMELCEAESLDKSLRGAPMALDRAKVVVAQIGQALLEAQKAGIVHRDVAPKNVLLTQAGDIKVINFPLAKPINDRAAGVAAYLSPEQVQGKPVDQRSNTYNLAALLYHLLTGEPPFQGTPETVLELHVGSPPLAPSQRRPEANLLPEVDRVILKALDKSSSRRHLTLRLFLSEVEALVGASSAPAAAGPGKDAGGFARTMLFAGGQAEVANLVAKAIAARGGSPAGGVPVTTPVAPSPAVTAPAAVAAPAPAVAPRRHPSPTGSPTTGTLTGSASFVSSNSTTSANSAPAATGPQRILSPTGIPVSPAPSPTSGEVVRPRAPTPVPAQAATTGSAPIVAPTGSVTMASGSITTPSSLAATQADPGQPAAATAPSTIVAAGTVDTPMAAADPSGGIARGSTTGSSRPAPTGKAAQAGKGNAFRETLWFKKGDVEHMIAEARAKIAGPEGKAPEAPSPAEEVLPIEDRYVDDGTVTSDDRKKFSLRAGQTSAAMPVVGTGKGRVPGERMSDEDVIREVSGSRKVVVILVAIVVVLAAAAAVLTLLRSKPTPPPARPPAATLIPAPPGATPSPSAAPKAAAASAKRDNLPAVPEIKHATKLMAAPPTKRDSDKRATRRKAKERRRR
jgi:eukaryotic-like serine/threonine-protein kinase